MSADNATLSAQVKKLNITDDTASDTAPSDLVAVVDDLLNQLSSKFSNLSGELIGKMDEMSRRLDNLEATIQAGNEQGRADNET
ncbi:hypothetical protein LTR91_010094 [Friedmanniomyces endolithicus]|uniref:Heat shock factor-binding protein 1 n=1 Tax=Friedmanniomyces endolithicus TaxID=329885 RepID=A0AAN6QT11_9PEZI|nr:hypothetical protein LTR94_017335 [Friedmanniomyces endolithicus]KAK0768406.1 hypothetical protein LTR59_017692 [Friedmanniomyces endolithicus]KAK0770186.1 hypothetical protein LTR38_017661 [Friedmanniomyces endolithicus]KAK0805883.1 hypothetical protein LTR75_007149 [Friedmanniomyces endolithicus]KAK0854380.1 hypothetical protein LTR03_002411 [Friedmanniomyces endolithicus]